MKEIYFTTTQTILILFALIAVGFWMRRKEVLPPSSSKTLSILETNLFLPALIFKNLSSNLKASVIKEHLLYLLTGIGFLIVTLLVAFLFAKLFGKKRCERNIFIYIFAFSNYAYFGYPVIQSVFGESMLSKTIILAIPFTITIYTLGIYLLTGKSEAEHVTVFQKIKAILSPVIIAVITGAVFGIFEIRIPNMLSSTIKMASDCMSPVSMILTGYVIASYSVTELLRSLKAYVVSAVRLIVIPLIIGFFLWFLGLRGDYLIIPVVISAMPIGMNVIIFTEALGRDSRTMSRNCFISYLMAMITIPIVFSVLEKL